MHSIEVTAIVFTVALLVCHAPIAWVHWAKSGEVGDTNSWSRAWERSDYLSIAFAALALLPASMTGQRYFNAIEIEQTLSRSEFAGSWSNSARNNHRYYFELTPAQAQSDEMVRLLNDAVQTVNETDPILKKARELVRAGDADTARAELKIAVSKFDRFTENMPIVQPSEPFFRDVDLLRTGLTYQRDTAERLSELLESNSSAPWETTYIVFAPHLLALGFAIRLAKVSAKLIPVRQSGRHQADDAAPTETATKLPTHRQPNTAIEGDS